MKLNTTDFRRKCQHPLLMALSSIPLGLMVIQADMTQMLDRFWCFPAAFVLLSWGCLVMPGKWRVAAGAISIAALFALGTALLPEERTLLMWLIPLMYAILLLVTLPIGGWPRQQELPLAWYVVGGLLYVLVQCGLDISSRTGTGNYAFLTGPLLICFLLYAALVLLALNRTSLEMAAQSRRRVPLLVRRQNLVITLAMLGLGTLIAAVPMIGSVLGKVWDLLMQGLVMLMTLLAALTSSKGSGSGGGGMEEDLFAIGSAQEPSQWAIIMEKLMGIFTLVILVVVLFFAGRALLKRLIRLAKVLWARLGQYGASASEDYEDEITDTRDEADTDRQGAFSRITHWGWREDKSLPPEERVRTRYKWLRQKHSDWGRGTTARETLPQEAATLYERARYSGETLSEAEADSFRENTKKV